MRQPSLSLSAAALACALCATTLPSQAQNGDRAVAPAVASKQKAEIAKGDPARWYRGDNTDQARLRILKKEIAAAYQEARNACHKGAASGRADCLKQARSTYQHDLSNAPAQLAQAPQSEVRERVTAVEAAPGAAQYGGSQAGATQSGAGPATGAQPMTQPAMPRPDMPRSDMPRPDMPRPDMPRPQETPPQR